MARNSIRNASTSIRPATLFSFRPRLGFEAGFAEGHAFRDWEDRVNGKPIPGTRRLVTLFGTQVEGIIAPGTEGLTIDDKGGYLDPFFDFIGKTVTVGSYVKSADGKVLLQYVEDDHFFYVLAVTGLLHTPVTVRHDGQRPRGQLWTDPDYLRLLKSGFDFANGAHGLVGIGGALDVKAKELELDLGGESETLLNVDTRRKIRGSNYAANRFSLTKIARKGGEAILRDLPMNPGEMPLLRRLVGMGTHLDLVDAGPVYQTLFDEAEELRRAERKLAFAAAKAAREAGKLKNAAALLPKGGVIDKDDAARR